MRFLDFKSKFKEFPVFSIKQVRAIEPDFNSSRLTEWQEKGYIKKIIKGYYLFLDHKVTESTCYHIANQIYQPSYISLETAFYHYALIPETVYGFTSISSRKTEEYITEWGHFYYQKIKNNLFWGYKLEKIAGQQFLMAEPEKAILDFFYLKTHLRSEEQIRGLRFDEEVFCEIVDLAKLMSYLEEFKNKNLSRRITILLGLLNND